MRQTVLPGCGRMNLRFLRVIAHVAKIGARLGICQDRVPPDSTISYSYRLSQEQLAQLFLLPQHC